MKISLALFASSNAVQMRAPDGSAVDIQGTQLPTCFGSNFSYSARRARIPFLPGSRGSCRRPLQQRPNRHQCHGLKGLHPRVLV